MYDKSCLNERCKNYDHCIEFNNFIFALSMLAAVGGRSLTEPSSSCNECNAFIDKDDPYEFDYS